MHTHRQCTQKQFRRHQQAHPFRNSTVSGIPNPLLATEQRKEQATQETWAFIARVAGHLRKHLGPDDVDLPSLPSPLKTILARRPAGRARIFPSLVHNVLVVFGPEMLIWALFLKGFG